MTRLGIVGCGRIVENSHGPALAALKDIVDVVAVADPSEERTALIGEALGVDLAHRYTDYRAMVEKESLDVVDVAVPHFLHEEVIGVAAAAGAHVLSEKPLGTSLAEVDRILASIAGAGVRLGVCHNYRYFPHVLEATRLIREGALGEMFAVRSESLWGGHYPGTTSYDPDWRTKSALSGGGALIDNGYHNVYVVEALMGSPITRVYASIGTFVQPIDVDDTAFLLCRHANGGTTSIQVSWAVLAGGRPVTEAYGTKGTVSFSRDGAPLSVYLNDAGEWSSPSLDEDSFGFEALFRDTLAGLVDGGPLPADGAAARHNIAVIEAAYRSSASGLPETVDAG
jgi:predicted dehydrogenase